MANPEKAWLRPEAANIPIQIEGTEVDLVTDQPVHPPKPRQPKPESQAEQLFPTSNQKKPPARASLPVRGRLAMPADVNAARREVENDLASTPLPEHPVGYDEAMRMIGPMPEVAEADEVKIPPTLEGAAVDIATRNKLVELSGTYGNQSAEASTSSKLTTEEMQELLRTTDPQNIGQTSDQKVE